MQTKLKTLKQHASSKQLPAGEEKKLASYRSSQAQAQVFGFMDPKLIEEELGSGDRSVPPPAYCCCVLESLTFCFVLLF